MSTTTSLTLAAAAVLLTACRSDAGAQEHASAAEPATMTTTAERIPIGDVSWFVDYDAAALVARAEGKPLWVHFGEDPG